MRKLSIVGTLQYVENDLSPTESALQVKAYLSTAFIREPQTIALTSENPHTLQVEGLFSRRKGNLSTSAMLNLASFALTANSLGAPCYVDAGTAHVPLIQVKKEFDETGIYKHTIPFVMHTADNLVKGKVQLTVTQLDMAGIVFEQPSPLISASIRRQGDRLTQYIESTIAVDQSVDNTIPNTENIQAPYDISENGLEFTGGIPLPVMAYTKYELFKSNSNYWDNALEVVLKRQNKIPSDYWNMSHAHQAQTMALLCVYAAQYLDYISDEVDRNTRYSRYVEQLKKGYESFGDAGTTWSGDCEDTGLMIAATFDSLLIAVLDRARYSSILQDIQQRIMPYYVPMMSLDIVHGAQVADQIEQPGAHLNTMFPPVHYLKKVLERHPEGKKLSQKVHWPPLDVHDDTDWPTLTGEGTGKYGPLGLLAEERELDTIERERSLIYNMPSLAGFKKDLVHVHGAASNFYVGHLMGITSYFLKRGIPVGSFVYGTRNAHHRNGWTRGALYTDLVNQDTNVIMVPHPPVPPDVMGLIDDITQNRVPPNHYVLDEDAPLPVRNALLDTLTRGIRPLSDPGDLAEVPVYARPHQLSEKLIGQIIKEASYVNGLHKITYELEPITNTIYGYRILFHVKRK